MKERIAVLLLAGLLFLTCLGSTDLWAPDEPTFAQAAREMLGGEGLALPHVNGRVFEDKPPLLFWLISLASLPAGRVTSWSARLPSALAGIALVLLTAQLARRLAGRRAGLVAALVLATCWMTFDKARSAQTDMLLALCVTAAVACLARSVAPRSHGWGREGEDGDAWPQPEVRDGIGLRTPGDWSMTGFWLFCALGTLAKGPVGLILPVGIAACWLVATGGPRNLRRLVSAPGLVCFALIAGGWALAAWKAGAPEGYDLTATLRTQALARFLDGRHHAEPLTYYASTLPRGLLPWSLFLPAVLWWGWTRRRDARIALACCWFLFPLVFFTLSVEKRDLYLLPMYPAFAILLADLVCRAGRVVTISLAATAALLIALGIGALAIPDPSRLAALNAQDGGDSTPALQAAWPAARWALLLGGAGAVGSLAALSRSRRRAASTGPFAATNSLAATGLLAAGTAGAYLVTAVFVNPALDPFKSSRPLAERVEAAAREAGEKGIVAYGLYRPGFSFYTDLRFEEAWDPGDLRALLKRDPARLGLAQESDLGLLGTLPGIRVTPVERGHVGHRQYVLLEIRSTEGALAGPEIALGGRGRSQP